MQRDAIKINVYCDESCHLLNDHQGYMGFGAISAPVDSINQHARKIREIKKQYGCLGELKWTKVSQKNILFYEALINYFFESQDLSFRSLIVHDKGSLDHGTFNDGSHDLFYYKMYYYLLRELPTLSNSEQIFVYLDIKDTHGASKVKKLRDVLSNYFHDCGKSKISRIQVIRSSEAELIQLTDFLLGAIMYATRNKETSYGKLSLTKLVEKKAGYSLTKSTEPWEKKLNLFHFWPQKNTKE